MSPEAAKAVSQLADDANLVAGEYKQQVAAKQRKQRAEDSLLEAIVAAVRPALPAISSKVDGLSGPVKRALFLGLSVNDAPLYLGEQGDFFLRASPAAIVVKSAGEVLDVLPLEAVFSPIVAAVRSQLGRNRNTAEIEREARVLEGVAQALRVGGAFR